MGQSHLCFGVPATENGEELLKMELLPSVSHINHFLWAPSFKPIHQSGEISRSVVGRAVALLDQRRGLFQLRNVVEENRRSALALSRDSFVAQFFYHSLQSRIVKAFPKRMIKFHSQALVNSIEL